MTSPDPLQQAVELHQLGQLDQAKVIYQQILSSAPTHSKALHLLGLVYAEENDLDLAQRYFEQAIAADASDPQIVLHLASILKAKNELNQAAELLQTLLKKFPKFVAGYNNLGTIYFAQDKLKDAIAAYKSAIALQADYADAYYNLGLAYTKMNNVLEASNAYDALLNLMPDHAGAQFQLARLHMQQGRYPQAIKGFEAILVQFPQHAESEINLATCFLRTGQLGQAEQHYSRAFAITPEDVQVLFNLGVLAVQQGRISTAIEYYLRIVKIAPEHFDAHNNLGFIYLGMRDHAAALAHYRAALQVQPNNVALKHTIRILTQDKQVSSSPIEYVRSLFDSYADHFDAHLTQALHYQTPHLLAAMIQKQELTNISTWDVLDLGCGTGLSGEEFKGKVHSLIGVDISENMLAVAVLKNIYTKLVQTDIMTFLQDKTSCYDLILAADTLVYFGDLNMVMTAVAKALKPRGLFAFNTEISGNEDYRMTESGRFAHSREYIDKLIAAVHLTCVEVQTAVLRTQNGQPVEGHLYLFKKESL